MISCQMAFFDLLLYPQAVRPLPDFSNRFTNEVALPANILNRFCISAGSFGLGRC
jgi:hypothetical protein